MSKDEELEHLRAENAALRDELEGVKNELEEGKKLFQLLQEQAHKDSHNSSAPLFWRDWPRRHQRHACLRLHRPRLKIQVESALGSPSAASPPSVSRAQRAHVRLS